ncbi:MAG: hypothetical protein IIC63_03755 [Proteobacteria bacterium]|nr:hypothetical protein [Pseudomonadota bacterium]
MLSTRNNLFRSAASLALVAVIGTALLAGVDRLTKTRIAEQEKRAILDQLGQLISPDLYNNELQQDLFSFQDDLHFPKGQTVTTYRARLDGNPQPAGVQPREIAFNAIPQIDVFTDNGYTKEELKMANETCKLLHAPDIALSATCVRIPSFYGHAMSIWAEFERPVDPAEARKLIGTMPGVRLEDAPAFGGSGRPIEEWMPDLMAASARAAGLDEHKGNEVEAARQAAEVELHDRAAGVVETGSQNTPPPETPTKADHDRQVYDKIRKRSKEKQWAVG